MRSSVGPEQRFPNVLDPPGFENAWKIYTHIREIENQFNALQSTYRSLASTWLLATFAGVGFVLTKTVDPFFDEAVIISLIGLAGGVGVSLLWLIDVMVYQKLLHAAFHSGVRLEQRYPWLPPIRLAMKRTQIKGQARHRFVWFYIAGVTMPLLMSLVFATLWLMGIKPGKISVGEALPAMPAGWIGLFAFLGLLAIVWVARYIYVESTKDPNFGDL